MADINDLDRLGEFFKLLLGEPSGGQTMAEITKAIVAAIGAGKAEVKPNRAFELRPEDEQSRNIIMDSLKRTRPARRKGNRPTLTREQL